MPVPGVKRRLQNDLDQKVHDRTLLLRIRGHKGLADVPPSRSRNHSVGGESRYHTGITNQLRILGWCILTREVTPKVVPTFLDHLKRNSSTTLLDSKMEILL